MMELQELLRKKADAITERWLGEALAMYPEESSALFARQKDPFANPVGHSLRVGTKRIFGAILDGMDTKEIQEFLREIIKIRAVQQFPPSQAVGFIFGLKNAIRMEIGNVAGDLQLSTELIKLEGDIDQIALAAFDIFVQCREQVYELRVNEVKRQFSWVVEKMNQRDPSPESARVELGEGV